MDICKVERDNEHHTTVITLNSDEPMEVKITQGDVPVLDAQVSENGILHQR